MSAETTAFTASATGTAAMHNPREIVLSDSSTYAPLGIVACVFGGSIAAGAGLLTDGWYSVPLLVVGVLLIALGVAIGVLHRVQGAARLRITERGLIHSIGDEERVLPKEVITGIGLLRPRGGPAELSVWYDTAKVGELPKPLRHFERERGRLRLGVVMDEVGGMSQRRVREIREYVQRHRLGEWRNRRL